MTKASDHSANLSKAREMLLVERRQLAAELTKSYQRGDGEKRERFTVVQSMIEGIDLCAGRSSDCERRGPGADRNALRHWKAKSNTRAINPAAPAASRLGCREIGKKGLRAKFWF
jgi:hypothetical protein